MELATGAMSSLILKLGELLKDEYKLHRDLRKQVESLSRELESLHAALRKVAQVPRDQLDEQVWIWARELRKASYAMEDVVDSFLVRVDGVHDQDPDQEDAAAKKSGSRRRWFKEKMGSLLDFKKLADRRSIAGKIQEIRDQLRDVASRRAAYKVDDIVVRPAAATSTMDDDPRLLDLYRVTKLFGIEGPREAVVSMLSDGDDEMKIVSIVGFGGLGKTTIAKAVYDKLKVKFQCGAFVPVGQNPDMKKIFIDILIGLDRQKYTNANMIILDQYQLISEIREFLQDKRYFIVIDDIWDTSSWELIKCALVDNHLGNVVVTTTRKSQVDTGGLVYTPKELSKCDSQKLFYMKIFGTEKCPEKYKSAGVYDKITKVSEKILEKCNGVPLAITTIASVLSKKPFLEWSNVYNTIGFGHDEGDSQVKKTMKILSYSYYDLPLHLRACLLYLSIFPEDHFIDKTMLIWRWIAEGFVHDEEGVGLFELGNRYFNDLVNRNMILPVEYSYSGFLNGCRVHDMMLHLLRSLSKEENFVSILDNEQHTSVDSRRVSIQNIEIDFENISAQVVMDMPQVRSVTAFGCLMDTLPQLSSFPVLRVLAAVESFLLAHSHYLEGLGSSLHLRYINLWYTPTTQLPKDIGHLKLLQVLEIEGTGIEELPESVALLRCLMCLHADRKTRMPDWIGKLTSLQELWIWPAADKYACFVEELGKLKELRVLVTCNVAPDESVERDLLESLRNLHKIMVIDFGLGSKFQLGRPMKTCEEGFTLSLHLRRLILRGFMFLRFPWWISPLFLPNLSDLEVGAYHVEQQDMEVLGGFTELRYLLLKIKCTKTNDKDILTCGGGALPNLKYCYVNQQLKFLHGSMPRLEDVHLNIRVWEVKRVSPDFDFDFGLLNLPAIQQVQVEIDCAFSRDVDVEEAEAALRHAVDVHPNSPTLKMSRCREEFMMLMTEEHKEKNEVVDQLLIQRDHFFAIREEIDEAQEVQAALPVNHPILLETIPLIEHLTKDVLGPDTKKDLIDDWVRLSRMDTSDRHGLKAQVAAARRHIKRLTLLNQQSTPLLEEIKAALNQEEPLFLPPFLDYSEDSE